MSLPAEFTVAELCALAGDLAFRAAGEHIVDMDGPDEDEWSLYATIRLDDGQELETILHHRAGKRLSGECSCPEGRAGRFCAHQVYVGLDYLGIDAPPATALAAEQASAGDLRPWLATLTPDELIALVIEAAEDNQEYCRALKLRIWATPPQR